MDRDRRDFRGDEGVGPGQTGKRASVFVASPPSEEPELPSASTQCTMKRNYPPPTPITPLSPLVLKMPTSSVFTPGPRHLQDTPFSPVTADEEAGVFEDVGEEDDDADELIMDEEDEVEDAYGEEEQEEDIEVEEFLVEGATSQGPPEISVQEPSSTSTTTAAGKESDSMRGTSTSKSSKVVRLIPASKKRFLVLPASIPPIIILISLFRMRHRGRGILRKHHEVAAAALLSAPHAAVSTQPSTPASNSPPATPLSTSPHTPPFEHHINAFPLQQIKSQPLLASELGNSAAVVPSRTGRSRSNSVRTDDEPQSMSRRSSLRGGEDFLREGTTLCKATKTAIQVGSTHLIVAVALVLGVA